MHFLWQTEQKPVIAQSGLRSYRILLRRASGTIYDIIIRLPGAHIGTRMAAKKPKDFKGYYCSRCHSYTRLYRSDSLGNFKGRCPGCGTEIFLVGDEAGSPLFFTGGSRHTPINLWDSYFQGKIIAQVERGTPAKVLETVDFRGITWYLVRAGRKQGWVSGTFIRYLK